MQERHSTVSEHSRRAQQLEQELAQVRAQLADSESLNEQLRLHGQSSDSKQEQLLQKLQSSEAAVSSLEIEHRAFVDKVNAACQSKDDEIRVRLLSCTSNSLNPIAACYPVSPVRLAFIVRAGPYDAGAMKFTCE